MTILTIVWIALPLFVGFSIYLLPQLSRLLALSVSCISLAYGLWHILNPEPVTLNLVDSFGVSLLVDQLSGFFILTNAIVTAAVVLYCWSSSKCSFFYTQAIILHGSVNAIFICADLISVYVALEVIGIAAFLLIVYPRTNRAVWVGLRYLFVSNTAMLFYLLGAALVFQSAQSFAFAALQNAPAEAIALILLGLLSKGGIFVSGLWLPLTHAESDTPVSALMSGVVVKAGVFPLLRFATTVPDIDPIVRIFGVATALFGVSFAILAQDTKRTLAFSTVSQLGFVMAAPVAGGFYALTHGLAKSALFLLSGNLHSRDIATLRQQPIATPLWITVAITSLSISGAPLIAGFGAKVLTTQNLLPWQSNWMTVATTGTAITFAKFIFLPHGHSANLEDSNSQKASVLETQNKSAKPKSEPKSKPKSKTGLWLALSLLIGSLLCANAYYLEAYQLKNLVKPLITIAVGWLIYALVVQKLSVQMPRIAEQFDHLIGAMSLMLILLFWMVLT